MALISFAISERIVFSKSLLSLEISEGFGLNSKSVKSFCILIMSFRRF